MTNEVKKSSSEQILMRNQYSWKMTLGSESSQQQFLEENSDNSSNDEVFFKKGLSKRESILITLCIVLCLFVFILISVQIFVVRSGKTEHCETNSVCTSKECILSSAKIMSSLDFSVDPCNDFYKFACGGWMKDNVIPENVGRYDVFEEVKIKRNILLRRGLERNSTKHEAKAVFQLRQLYKSCVNAMNDEKAVENLKQLINSKLGGSVLTNKKWKTPSVNLITVLTRLDAMIPRQIYLTKLLPFFDSTVVTDVFNSTQNILQITVPGLGMYDSSVYNSTRQTKVVAAYRSSMVNIATLLLGNQIMAKECMDEVFDLEKKIALTMPPIAELRNIKKVTSKLKIADLMNSTGHKFDWLAYLNLKIKNTKMKLTGEDSIIVRSFEFVKDITRIIETTPKRAIANYVTWILVQNMLDALPRAFKEAYNEYEYAATGAKKEQARWETCIDHSESLMGMALGYLYVKEGADTSMRKDVEELVKEIKLAYVSKLRTLQWMDQKTKEKAVKKTENMKGNIAFPSYLMNTTSLNNLYLNVDLKPENYMDNIINVAKLHEKQNLEKLLKPVDREEWLIPPTPVNAFYDVSRNKMVFLAGILQPPFYTPKGPKSINFGSIGFVMGHELTHGFDDQGRLYDDRGDLRNWWTEKSAKKFQEKSKCVVNQYSNYSIDGIHLNGELTLGENIADNGGLKAAFKAYKDWMQRSKTDLVLPGLNLTNDQLFFLSSAQVWCNLKRKSMITKGLTHELHSPGEFRVKGMLSNNEQFASAYKCTKGSPMNPVKKCEVW